MSRCERSSTVLTSNRPVEDSPTLLGDVVVVTPLLDRLMHRGTLLTFDGKCGRLKEAAERVAKRAAAGYSTRPLAAVTWGILTWPRVGECEVAARGLVSGIVRAPGGGRSPERRRSRRVPRRTGVHPALDARASTGRGGARRPRRLLLRLRASVPGWQRSHGPIPDDWRPAAGHGPS